MYRGRRTSIPGYHPEQVRVERRGAMEAPHAVVADFPPKAFRRTQVHELFTTPVKAGGTCRQGEKSGIRVEAFLEEDRTR